MQMIIYVAATVGSKSNCVYPNPMIVRPYSATPAKKRQQRGNKIEQKPPAATW